MAASDELMDEFAIMAMLLLAEEDGMTLLGPIVDISAKRARIFLSVNSRTAGNGYKSISGVHENGLLSLSAAC